MEVAGNVNSEMEIGYMEIKIGIGDWVEMEIGDWRLEIGDWRLEREIGDLY